MENKAKNKVVEEDSLTDFILLGGIGISGYFLWKYFKKGPEDIEQGFNITNYTIPKTAFPGSQVDIVIIAQNNTDEEMDGYCRIIDIDTLGEVAYDHVIVGTTPETKMHTFNFVFAMSGDELKLNITTGNHTTQDIHSGLNWTITPIDLMDIHYTNFVLVLNP